MLKLKNKLFISLFLMITLVTSYCFASEPTTTSLLPGDNAKTVTEENVEAIEVNEEDTENADTAEPEILSDDLYLFDTTVTMDKLVDGNVYICATTANITGQVNGNLYVIAKDVTFDGAYVANSIFICSTNTTFNAACNDLYFIGTTLNVSYDSYIARDSRIGGNNITFKGLNYRNMFIDANTINFGEGEEIAAIQGNLDYSAPNELSLPEGAVSGEVTYNQKNLNIISDIIYTLIFSIIVYWAFKFFTPKFTKNISNFSKLGKFFISGGIGLAAAILSVIIIFILLLLAFIAFDLSLPIIATILLTISLTFSVFSLFVTKLLKSKFNKIPQFVLFMIVVVILSLTKYIPFVGSLLGYIYGIFGFGMIIISLAKKNTIAPKKDENNVIEEK